MGIRSALKGGGLAACLVLAAGSAMAASQDDFLVRTTGELTALCDAPPMDPLHVAAVHFCQGYVVGAFAYHQSENGAGNDSLGICFPEPHPTREEGIHGFIAWAKAHPEFSGERPVDTLFRYLRVTYPCK